MPKVERYGEGGGRPSETLQGTPERSRLSQGLYGRDCVTPLVRLGWRHGRCLLPNNTLTAFRGPV